jgi:hypothetical protein
MQKNKRFVSAAKDRFQIAKNGKAEDSGQK